MIGASIDRVVAPSDRLSVLAHSTLRDLADGPARRGLAGAIGDAIFACELQKLGLEVDRSFWLSRAIGVFNRRGGGPSLHLGLAGLGFLLAVYAEGVGEVEENLSFIDRTLTASLNALPPASVQSGVAGIALYASLRSSAETGQHLQRAVLAVLTAAATPSDGGVVWHTPVEYARSRGLDVPHGPITEFGVVHGIGGTLVALAALAAEGHDTAAELARAGVHAVWAHERGDANRFGRMEFGPAGSLGTHEFGDRRWCVADPGILRALWLTANVIGDAPATRRALERLREDAARDLAGAIPGAVGRFDLCCGASVVAQVYRRMHAETGELVFQGAADKLLGRCTESVERVVVPNFAYGRAGIILALLASRTEERPTWDSILCITLPRRFQDTPMTR